MEFKVVFFNLVLTTKENIKLDHTPDTRLAFDTLLCVNH